MDLPENKLRGYIQDNGKPMWTAHNNHNMRYFKEDEIKIITNNYNTLLGKGAFGEVYKGVLDDSSPVAVKRYIHNVKENFAKEVIVHCEINHRNVVRLIGCCIGEKELMMVTEYISRGNLSDILHCSETSISLETRLGIAIGCAEALSYMHSQMYGQVIHGDIKPANILLDENLNAKISDFGISKLLSTDNTLYTTHVIGSIGYMDLLFARSGRLTSKSDVYSFGVVLLELITRRKAVDEGKISLTENFTQALAKRKKIRDFYDVKVSDDNNLRILDGIVKVAAKCLAMDIEKRPEMKDVAEHLRKLRKAQYESRENIALFGWVWRSKQAPQNMVPTDKMDQVGWVWRRKQAPQNMVPTDKMGQVIREEVQAQKAGEAVADLGFRHRDDEFVKKKKSELKRQGTDAFRNEDYLKALEFYTQALKVDQFDATLFSNRSICWLRLGDGMKALYDAIECKNLRPKWAKAYYRKGAALMFMKDYDSAYDALSRGLELDPESEEMETLLWEAMELK